MTGMSSTGEETQDLVLCAGSQQLLWGQTQLQEAAQKPLGRGYTALGSLGD